MMACGNICYEQKRYDTAKEYFLKANEAAGDDPELSALKDESSVLIKAIEKTQAGEKVDLVSLRTANNEAANKAAAPQRKEGKEEEEDSIQTTKKSIKFSLDTTKLSTNSSILLKRPVNWKNSHYNELLDRQRIKFPSRSS